jgi:hypothetical protein
LKFTSRFCACCYRDWNRTTTATAAFCMVHWLRHKHRRIHLSLGMWVAGYCFSTDGALFL